MLSLLDGAAAEKLVITPYSGEEHVAQLVHDISNTLTPRPSERSTLVFFRGHCGPWEQASPSSFADLAA